MTDVTEQDAPVRWGILGPGFIAGIFAADLARTPGAELVAVASRDAGRAQAFAADHAVARHYGDYASLAEDPDVEIVYIASPHSHHHEHAKLMLEHGKAVLVEKPFTMNAAEAEDLVSIARSRGLFLMEAMWTLCNPLVIDLAARVRAGAIGSPQAFSASLGPIGGVPKGHRIEDPALGASFILECMVYPLSILAALAPELVDPASVSASVVLSDRGVDTAAAITLTSGAGVGTMAGGFATGTEGAGLSTFHLIGSDGWLQVDDNLFNPGRARVSSRGAEVETVESPLALDGYRWEIEEAGRCLRAGAAGSALVPLDLTLRVMRLMDESRSAAGLAPWR